MSNTTFAYVIMLALGVLTIIIMVKMAGGFL